jgi:hypothetical protein
MPSQTRKHRRSYKNAVRVINKRISNLASRIDLVASKVCPSYGMSWSEPINSAAHGAYGDEVRQWAYELALLQRKLWSAEYFQHTTHKQRRIWAAEEASES